MPGRPEDVLFFFAALAEPGENVLRRVRELTGPGLDREYLVRMAEKLGVAAGLIDLISRAGVMDEKTADRLRPAAARELSRTVIMEMFLQQISALLDAHGIPFIPLKGSDIRIAEGSRRTANPMADLDILVRTRDVDRTRVMLTRNGFIFQGALSGAHLNFCTDSSQPCFLEVHVDLINRWSPVQRRLFHPDMKKIWDRSVTVCDRLHLSPEDLICYTVSHGIKETFRRPKWTADAEFLIRHILPGLDPEKMRARIGEWGVGTAMGILAEAFLPVYGNGEIDCVYDVGARRPGIVGKYLASRLLGDSRRWWMHFALYFACAESMTQRFSVIAGVTEYLFRRIMPRWGDR